MTHRITIQQGDITAQEVDAIVNAASRSLHGGGGVDGAIHRAAGPGLTAECRALGGCDTGQAVVTGGHRLPARWVIHTVGPVWGGGRNDEDGLLAGCYRSCLDVVTSRQLASVAFPAISTGLYGFPEDRAARIAVTEVTRHLAAHRLPERVCFVCYDPGTHAAYLRALREQDHPE